MNGFINVFKPAGMSSAFCVGLLKRKLKVPCGHMGTLDPMASGVLPIGVGKASRLFPYLLSKEKVYIAKFAFGYETDTLDKTGKVLKTDGKKVFLEEINGVLPFFIGDISQMPPKYSAKSVNGKRGYQLAREGKEFTLTEKIVSVYEITAEKTDKENEFTFKITCGGGTYIRSLCRDIAYKLGTVATMTELCRVKSGIFSAENSVNAEDLKNIEDFSSVLIPSDSVINFPKIVLDNKEATRLLNGLYDDYSDRCSEGLYRVYAKEEFWGVGEIKEGLLKMKSYVRG